MCHGWKIVSNRRYHRNQVKQLKPSHALPCFSSLLEYECDLLALAPLPEYSVSYNFAASPEYCFNFGGGGKGGHKAGRERGWGEEQEKTQWQEGGRGARSRGPPAQGRGPAPGAALGPVSLRCWWHQRGNGFAQGCARTELSSRKINKAKTSGYWLSGLGLVQLF